MAQATWLELVSPERIDELRTNPTGIAQGVAPFHATHHGQSLTYFLCGGTVETSDSPLRFALHGAETIACPTLENGYFSVVSPDEVAEIADRLASVDLSAVAAAVHGADFDELMDEYEIDDLELLTPEDAPGILAKEAKRLAIFYAKAAEGKLGVIMYVT